MSATSLTEWQTEGHLGSSTGVDRASHIPCLSCELYGLSFLFLIGSQIN
jgi:hypothetical protein